MKLLVVICDRNLTKRVLKTLNDENIGYHISFFGRGTASSKILSYFGLESSEKEIILSTSSKEGIENILIKLNEHEFIKNHGAVAFTIPMDGISQKTIEYILKMEENNERI